MSTNSTPKTPKTPSLGGNKKRKNRTPGGSARKKLDMGGNLNKVRVVLVDPPVVEGEESPMRGLYLLLDGPVDQAFSDVWYKNKPKKDIFVESTEALNWRFKKVDINDRSKLLVKGISSNGKEYFYDGTLWELSDDYDATEANIKDWVEKTYIPNLLEAIGEANHHKKPVCHETEFLTVVPAWSHVIHDNDMWKLIETFWNKFTLKPITYFKENKGHVYSFFDIEAGHLSAESVARFGITKEMVREKHRNTFVSRFPTQQKHPLEDSDDDDSENDQEEKKQGE